MSNPKRNASVNRFYRLHYNEANNEFVAKWVFDEQFRLMETPQYKVGDIGSEWPTDIELGLQEGGEIGDILFSPDALICLPSGREKLAKHPEVDALIEWLPVRVISLGECYVCHPRAHIPFQSKSVVTRVAGTGNVTSIQQWILDDDLYLPPVFLMACPLDSRAGEAGYGMRSIYLSDTGKAAFEQLSGVRTRLIFDSEESSP